MEMKDVLFNDLLEQLAIRVEREAGTPQEAAKIVREAAALIRTKGEEIAE